MQKDDWLQDVPFFYQVRETTKLNYSFQTVQTKIWTKFLFNNQM